MRAHLVGSFWSSASCAWLSVCMWCLVLCRLESNNSFESRHFWCYSLRSWWARQSCHFTNDTHLLPLVCCYVLASFCFFAFLLDLLLSLMFSIFWSCASIITTRRHSLRNATKCPCCCLAPKPFWYGRTILYIISFTVCSGERRGCGMRTTTKRNQPCYHANLSREMLFVHVSMSVLQS